MNGGSNQILDLHVVMNASPESATGARFRAIVVNNFGFVASSPVWSFTTENPNAVQASTWGAVKALYR